jgi:DNA-directed RNA polymerase specialized sigma24 family protein
LRREVPLAAASSPQTPDGDVVAPEPTPAEAALLADAVEVVMNRLGTETKRRVFELSLQGYSVAEISDRIGYYERGVERARAEARALLLAIMNPESASSPAADQP